MPRGVQRATRHWRGQPTAARPRGVQHAPRGTEHSQMAPPLSLSIVVRTHPCRPTHVRVHTQTQVRATGTHARARTDTPARTRPHGNARTPARYELLARHGARTLHAIKRIGTLPPASTDLQPSESSGRNESAQRVRACDWRMDISAGRSWRTAAAAWAGARRESVPCSHTYGAAWATRKYGVLWGTQGNSAGTNGCPCGVV